MKEFAYIVFYHFYCFCFSFRSVCVIIVALYSCVCKKRAIVVVSVKDIGCVSVKIVALTALFSVSI